MAKRTNFTTLTRPSTLRLIMMSLMALCLTTAARRSAVADDDADDTDITIQAPLTGADCSAVPATITVLGVTVDVSAAAIDAPVSLPTPTATPSVSATTPGSADDGGRKQQGGSGTPARPAGCYYYCTSTPVPTPTAGCGDLVVGQTVRVKLTNDGPALAARAVRQDAANTSQIKIQAPIQAVDATAQTLTVLGLNVDVSNAALEGASDDSSNAESQPIDRSELLVGQFAELTLASADAPFVASKLEVKNFGNQVEIEIEDQHGNQIDDLDRHGNPIDDVSVDIVQTIAVPDSSAAGTASRTKRVIELHTKSNGRLVLSGLPKGHAKIVVTRAQGDSIVRGGRRLLVRGDTVRRLRVRLRSADHR